MDPTGCWAGLDLTVEQGLGQWPLSCPAEELLDFLREETDRDGTLEGNPLNCTSMNLSTKPTLLWGPQETHFVMAPQNSTSTDNKQRWKSSKNVQMYGP